MADERMSALDTAFLCLESVQAPMHLGALAIFDPAEPIKPSHLVALLSERAGRLPWLRRRVGLSWLPPGAGIWVEDRLFNAKRHVHLHQLNGADPDEVAGCAAELMADPLNLSRPLWQLHILTGLPGGRFALLVKLHHALADGLRAAELGISLLDGFTDLAGALPGAGVANLSLSGMLRTARSVAESAASLAARPDRLIGHLAGAAANVPTVARQVADIAGVAGAILSSARLGGTTSPLAMLPSGAATPGSLRAATPDALGAATPGGAGADAAGATAASGAAAGLAAGRQLALLRLDLADIRQIRRRHGGTDNDVMLAIVTGALREWLTQQGKPVDRLNVRALIPVSRRTRPGEQRRGNLLSGYLCELPVQERDPLACLARIRTTMDRNKAAGPARGAGALPVLAELVPSAMHRVVTPLTRQSAGRLFDTIVTNVPIPAVPLALAGAPLREVYPIAPLALGHNLGIAMSAHRGTVHVGLHGNGPALIDLNRLATGVPAALASLTAAG